MIRLIFAVFTAPWEESLVTVGRFSRPTLDHSLGPLSMPTL
jgi:hypothetical protein